MKRCPKCSFIYLDTDETCDLDQTPLVFVDEAELDPGGKGEITAAGNMNSDTASTPVRNRRPLIGVALGALIVAVALVAVYFGTRSQRHQTENSNNSASVVTQQQTPTPSLSPYPSPSVEPSPSPVAKTSPTPRETTDRGVVSTNPVSTGRDDRNRSGPVTIRLTNGARIEADEAWRTKEGIWYRRQGMVTLLKRSQVRAIERK